MPDPIDLTSRGIALQIEEAHDPGAQPELVYRFINTSSESWTLAKLRGDEQSGFGGQLVIETNAGGATPGDTTTERLRIDKDGNVGIGTASPTQALEVNGAVKATDFIKGATSLVSSQWTDVAGGISYAGGNVGIGTTSRRSPLGIRAQGVGEELISFEDPTGKTKWHINQNLGGTQPGLNFVETGIADGRLFLQVGGNVGIGTITPQGKLDVQGDIRAGNSDIYFTKIDHNHTGIGNTAGYAAIENATNYGALMILGRAGTPRGRYVRLWDYLQVNGNMDVTGSVGIGTSSPGVKFHVLGNRIRLEKVGVPSQVLDMRADGSALDLESSFDLYLNNNNVPVYYRNLHPVSSREHKENIADLAISEAIEILDGLHPVRFNYKDDAKQALHLGFIAEDVPAAIATADRKGISPMNITAVLCSIVRQHQQTIAALREEIQTLRVEKLCANN
jgi:hypothetical protein